MMIFVTLGMWNTGRGEEEGKVKGGVLRDHYYNSQYEIKIEKQENIIELLQQKIMIGNIQKADF